MRIAVFFNLPYGGARRVVYEEVKGLAKNHDIDLYRLEEKSDNFLNPDKFCKNIYVYDFKLKSSLPYFFARLERDYRNFVLYIFLHKQIARDIDSRHYDIVLAHSDYFTESPLLLRYIKTPSVFYDHEILAIVYCNELKFKKNVGLIKKSYEDFTRNIRKKMDFNTVKKTQNILTNSLFMKKFIQKIYKKNVNVCYPGVDSKVFKKRAKIKNRVLFIGGKNEIIGYNLAKDAIKIVNNNYKIALNVINKNKFLKNDVLLAKKYSESVTTLCLSSIEAFGLKAIESIACETPVIAISSGAYPEIIKNGQNGFFVKDNPFEIANKIEFYLKHPEDRVKIGKIGRQKVIEDFTWEKHVDCLESHIKEIVK